MFDKINQRNRNERKVGEIIAYNYKFLMPTTCSNKINYSLGSFYQLPFRVKLPRTNRLKVTALKNAHIYLLL